MPGEARLATRDRQWSANRRIMIPAVCHPLAIRPPNGPRAANSGSTWIGWGSNARANSRISASVTVMYPYSYTAPGG